MKYILILILFMQFCANANQKVIKIGYFEAFPFVFKNKFNKLVGILFNKLLNHLGLGGNYKIEFYEFPLARAFFELRKENIDIFSLVTEQSFIEMKVTHRSIAVCNIQEYIFVPKETSLYLGFSKKLSPKIILQINELIRKEQKNLEVICSLD
ncbi:hypothetical protein [Fluviispira sanaruensis]|uniref:Solute-binding protein family 3/N-terminal domain-containing protein n=1 Tax=Fluviispira sanaruensis TaxID=2493639 RepID=A0A4P2VK35_FLUSA|nr:hypothetical protein [Fluviispira sanaruensis]BBH53111.1 hypothetical protein JCM31447_15540 [Fluviispira sanaruensis]